jgi:D-alanyl-lipoteichoic acid acyltransferase DltB (MBOAT superfamily)
VGKVRQGFNVVVTMLLGGLWHGASWNFVLWGALHGGAIAINHAGRNVAERLGLSVPAFARWPWHVLCVAVTFVTVTLLWVFFRAETMGGAGVIFRSLAGTAGETQAPLLGSMYFALVAGMMGIVFLLPNSMRVMFDGDHALRWRPNRAWAVFAAGLLLLGVMFVQSHLGKAFIYFDF